MLTKKILNKLNMTYLTIPYLHTPKALIMQPNFSYKIPLKNGGILRVILSIYLSLLNLWKENNNFSVLILDEIARLMFFNLD